MAFLEKRSGSSRISPSRPTNKPSSVPPPKGLFGVKKEHTRSWMRESFRKASLFIGGGGMLNKEERAMLEKSVFPCGKFGEYISERDYNRALKDLNKEEFRVSTGVEKRKIREKIRFLKGVLKK